VTADTGQTFEKSCKKQGIYHLVAAAISPNIIQIGQHLSK